MNVIIFPRNNLKNRFMSDPLISYNIIHSGTKEILWGRARFLEKPHDGEFIIPRSRKVGGQVPCDYYLIW